MTSIAGGRIGRFSNPPPQLGHTPPSRSSTQCTQNVHSYVQIRASGESGGRSRSQHSQDGRSSSMRAIVRDRPRRRPMLAPADAPAGATALKAV